jgi:hypothetical protein
VGGERIAKALVGWLRMLHDLRITRRLTLVNGEPGIVFHYPDGRTAGVSAFEIADGVVVAIRTISNPDKLAHVSRASWR